MSLTAAWTAVTVKRIAGVFARGLFLLPLLALVSPMVHAQDSADRVTEITLAVYPVPYSTKGDLRNQAMALRDELRKERRLVVLLYNPDTPTFQMAARSADPAISLDHPLSQPELDSLTGSAGAGYQVIVTHSDSGGAKSMSVSLDRVGQTVARGIWHWTGKDMKQAASQLRDALLAPSTLQPSPQLDAPPAPIVSPTVPDRLPAAPQAAPEPAPVNLGVIAPPAERPSSVAVKVDIQPLTPTPVVVAPLLPAGGDAALPPLPAEAPVPAEVIASDRPPAASNKRPSRDHGELGDEARRKMNQASMSLQQADILGAIDAYRDAVCLAPYATQIRLKLADAYVQAGYPKEAVDEARRAMTLDPRSREVGEFLKRMSEKGLLPAGDPTALLAAVSRDPDNTSAWIALGDGYLAAGQPDMAKGAYEHAASLQPEMPDPQIKLLSLSIGAGQFEQAFTAYGKAGVIAYPETLRIVLAAADNLFNAIKQASADYEAGKSTREGYYRIAMQSDAQARGLQGFVSRITPPDSQKVGYLHLSLGAQLASQATAAWVGYIETNDQQYREQADPLQEDARRELKTAVIAAKILSEMSETRVK
ncbi:MAG: hypothetical protein P4L33_06475 [Capsulimonadaceae bacterium]|nr:hypothetical protein [Capsulimonadaceae bacterium]